MTYLHEITNKRDTEQGLVASAESVAMRSIEEYKLENALRIESHRRECDLNTSTKPDHTVNLLYVKVIQDVDHILYVVSYREACVVLGSGTSEKPTVVPAGVVWRERGKERGRAGESRRKQEIV